MLQCQLHTFSACVCVCVCVVCMCVRVCVLCVCVRLCVCVDCATSGCHPCFIFIHNPQNLDDQFIYKNARSLFSDSQCRLSCVAGLKAVIDHGHGLQTIKHFLSVRRESIGDV